MKRLIYGLMAIGGMTGGMSGILSSHEQLTDLTRPVAFHAMMIGIGLGLMLASLIVKVVTRTRLT